MGVEVWGEEGEEERGHWEKIIVFVVGFLREAWRMERRASIFVLVDISREVLSASSSCVEGADGAEGRWGGFFFCGFDGCGGERGEGRPA